MSTDSRHTPKPQAEITAQPFESAEEAWFWFIKAQDARNDGARFVMGAGLVPRSCEPTDILNILYRLYRNRLLLMDHVLVLRHYGRRQMSPDPRRVREGRAFRLWREALDKLEPALESRGIVQKPTAQIIPLYPETK